jgi:hypothetical protein
MSELAKFLPGTVRATSPGLDPGMVEGAILLAQRMERGPSTPRCAGAPPARAGEEL